ncbi:MAG: DUF3710 domain-containing protein [Rhodoluna sp.]|nr:DUF3710 domain-containing protein [Rhodoluna sp.]
MNEFSTSSIRQPNRGPWDSNDLNAPSDLVDFGSVAFVPNPNVGVRADIEEGTQRIVAVSFDYMESVLQVQAFAAAKGENLWDEVVKDITESLTSQNISVEQSAGPHGSEIQVELPLGDGRTQVVRMFGFSGDRWLLRGTISGAAITDLNQRLELEDVFRGLVVRRGETPYPPREILPLSLPTGSIVTKAN